MVLFDDQTHAEMEFQCFIKVMWSCNDDVISSIQVSLD